jgi:hypothetical protein
MVKPGMQGSRIDKGCHRELSDSSKPLDDLKIKNCDLLTVEPNEVVHRVTKFDFSHGAGSFRQ